MDNFWKFIILTALALILAKLTTKINWIKVLVPRKIRRNHRRKAIDLIKSSGFVKYVWARPYKGRVAGQVEIITRGLGSERFDQHWLVKKGYLIKTYTTEKEYRNFIAF